MKKVLYTLLCLLLASACTTETVSDARQETVQPQIYPDYLGVTIPVNIAPLNFSMADDAALLIDAVITDRHGNNLRTRETHSASPFRPSMPMAGTPTAPSPSMSVLTASTTASVTALSPQAMRCGAKWAFTSATSPRLMSVR